jgi:phosphohistidine phosphatase SixA
VDGAACLDRTAIEARVNQILSATGPRITLLRALPPEQRQDARIYDATPGTLMQIADDHRECASLMLIGHNPGMEHLVALLTSGQSGDFRGLPAAGLVVLHIPADAEFEPGIATLEHFWWP